MNLQTHILFLLISTILLISRISPSLAASTCEVDVVEPEVQATTSTYHPALESYVKRHAERLSKATHLSQVPVVYFHAQRTGVADRLLGLTSAFLLAFTLDRTLLVSFGHPAGDVGLLFKKPGWDWTRALDSFEDYKSTSIAKLDMSWKVFLSSETTRKVQCQNLTKLYEGVDLLDLGSNEWWVPLLFTNPYHRHIADELDPVDADKQRLFEIVTDFLLRPVQRLSKQIQMYKAKHQGASKVLSMHVRVGHSAMDMVNASGYIEGWYKPDVNTFITCAKSILDGWLDAEPNAKISIFVATDNLAAQQTVERTFASEDITVVYTEKQWSSEGRLISTDPNKTLDEGQYTLEGFESAVVDYWLLGEADSMVASTMSSVASFAPGRGSIAPLVATVDKQCIQVPASRTQPCMHLLREDYRSSMVEPGDYSTASLCASGSDVNSPYGIWNVRRRSAFYHSEAFQYTCVMYRQPWKVKPVEEEST